MKQSNTNNIGRTNARNVDRKNANRTTRGTSRARRTDAKFCVSIPPPHTPPIRAHGTATIIRPTPSRRRAGPYGRSMLRPNVRPNRPNARTPRNYAFIDSQNLVKSVRAQGWNLDWKSFRRYLQTELGVAKALLFIGYIEDNKALYDDLKKAGFTLVFKQTVEIHKDGQITYKGNVDTDLVLHALLEREHYEKAVIVSGDGDFHSLAKHLEGEGKLQTLLVPSGRRYSTLLNDFEDRIVPMDGLRRTLQGSAR